MITGLDRYKNKWHIASDTSIKAGLDAIEQALAELGNPHKNQNFIHIAGTNGKGSTAAFIAAILMQHGKTVGNFFSPAIEDVHDQIQIDREPVNEEDFDAAFEQLSKILTPLTDFELLTAAAYLVFNRRKPDFTIIEAGMGGRFDSTNVIDPLISVIPSISLEHTNFLGSTIAEIAWHKAGIIKKGKPVAIGDLPEEAEKVISTIAKDMSSEILKSKDLYEGPLKLKGQHQKANASLAWVATEKILKNQFKEQMAIKGLSQAAISYRFEEVFPDVIFDGAHNEASVEALIETVREIYPDRAIHVVMGLLKDKDHEAILRKLETVSDHFTFLDFENERALPAKILFSKSSSKIKTILNHYDILPVSSKNEVTIVTGSLYLLAILRKRNYSMFEHYRPD
ncbi:bifunctional folylpolyglutamate synthase/dihydrofolate synthase [Planococcus halotolerans]|uniref:tetrahydrofolate synthase n=1 Tax=Planococcus halotolerans TaxID=2233542 RepID=A0A365KTM7_9BACL|nr:folylpolyglutamate synthase/dihydrofolate synthase family protein [Planococcus halotolerans]QHJ71597.1 bifunctional folylpolyglutamate synthase/dihydrofolate synthase [Planococcus halotolerans]RAZ76546.1 bifunctional folylpolyglutamate synthase/dihydrofolate synthase [Planococcus halotolerans]